MKIVLAATYHDPNGRLLPYLQQYLPTMTTQFAGIVVRASYSANASALALMQQQGVQIVQGTAVQDAEGAKLGRSRRIAVASALKMDADFILYCDSDRMLHWVKNYPTELAETLAQITAYDFTVIGRTARAFADHPRIQSATEGLVNEVFASVSGHAWDITAATRGLSRAAADFIVAHNHDDEVSTDASWTLQLMENGRFSLGYIETEGMEFETGDAFPAEIAAAGSMKQWKAGLDRDPARWARRLDLARIEIAAMTPFYKPS